MWARPEIGGGVVAGHVVVDEQIFERQGIKVVVTEEGEMRQYSPGEVADLNGELVQHDGEPSFRFRLDREVRSDEDVPDAVGLALRAASDRLSQVLPDGSGEAGDEPWVESVGGPYLQDGALMVVADTDGSGFSRAMIDTMVRILVEELTPVAVPVEISAAPFFTGDWDATWRSSEERAES